MTGNHPLSGGRRLRPTYAPLNQNHYFEHVNVCNVSVGQRFIAGSTASVYAGLYFYDRNSADHYLPEYLVCVGLDDRTSRPVAGWLRYCDKGIVPILDAGFWRQLSLLELDEDRWLVYEEGSRELLIPELQIETVGDVLDVIRSWPPAQLGCELETLDFKFARSFN